MFCRSSEVYVFRILKEQITILNKISILKIAYNLFYQRSGTYLSTLA